MSYRQTVDAAYSGPNSIGNPATMKSIEVTFSAVFRRNYDWGRYAMESWQQTQDGAQPTDEGWKCSRTDCATAYSQLGLQVQERDSVSGISLHPSVDVASDYTADTNGNGIDNEQFYMRFPPFNGRGIYTLDATSSVPSEQEYVQPCPNAFYCDIVKPECSKLDYDWPMEGSEPIYTGPPLNAKSTSPSCAYDYTWNPKRCGEWAVKDGRQCQGSTLCANYTGSFDEEANATTATYEDGVCASWDSLFGMYMGDGKARTMVLTSSDIEVSCLSTTECASNPNQIGCEKPESPDCNAFTGNFIRGFETFEHAYMYERSRPYMITFTGGNRLFQCNYQTDPLDSSNIINKGLDPEGKYCTGTASSELDNLLNNNQEGRYRLEMEVWLFDDQNQSPVVYQEAVLPVIRSLSTGRTPFQIPAYDQDLDYLVFRFGTAEEMGGITKSKMAHYPYSQADNTGINGADSSFAFTNTTENTPSIFDGRQYAAHFCNNDIQTYSGSDEGFCPTDRVPYTIWGTTEYSFTTDVPGLVEWRTWYPPVADENTPSELVDTKLPRGLYNMVVMVHDVSVIENDDGTIMEDTEKMEPYVSRTQSGNLDHKVFDMRYNQTFNYKVKVPLDYLLYLYEGPIGFCNKGCKDNKPREDMGSILGNANKPSDNDYPGAATFVDVDGTYGSIFPSTAAIERRFFDSYPPVGFFPPYEGMDQLTRRRMHECTICTYGDEIVECTPFSADGVCGTTGANDAIVPTEDACKENTPPYFTRTKTYSYSSVGGYNNTDQWLDDAYLARSRVGATEISSTGQWIEWGCSDRTEQCSNIPVARDSNNFTWATGYTRNNSQPLMPNPAPYKKFMNNPFVDSWYESLEHVQNIVPQKAGDVETVERRPYVGNVTSVGFYDLPNITVFKGEAFEFYVTAKDDDDCVELSLKVTGLPASPPTTVGSSLVPSTQAQLLQQEIFSYYPEFPQGAVARRRFLWEPPALAVVDPIYDTRPVYSFVCFYASDEYLLSNAPLYCIELVIVDRPEIIEELNECYCRTCTEEGKFVANREVRPSMNFAPRRDEYLNYVEPVDRTTPGEYIATTSQQM
eukprot:CAMPEP_0114245448 /NCGR_PEP_ID=MMETSP0058-20121206/11899_1 /TAXON_ID=36894 /ORGANISM="Pyramimonas parkeae, CCMP726" /LENGTH=1077 /DNA_ID=CAMNT_0001358497 /DNA_START=212 /DNA_END=3445 /DNA_ORIENTATION=-